MTMALLPDNSIYGASCGVKQANVAPRLEGLKLPEVALAALEAARDENTPQLGECLSPASRWEREPCDLNFQYPFGMVDTSSSTFDPVSNQDSINYGTPAMPYSALADMSGVLDGQQASFPIAEDFSNEIGAVGGYFPMPQLPTLSACWPAQTATSPSDWCQTVEQKAQTISNEVRTPAKVYVDLSCLKPKLEPLATAKTEGESPIVPVASSPVLNECSNRQHTAGGSWPCGQPGGARGGRARPGKSKANMTWQSSPWN